MGAVQQILVVVPCFNEERRLFLEPFVEALKKTPELYFLFVNDGSTDGTGKLLNSGKAESERIEVLTLKKNFGKGEAVRRGITASVDKPFKYIGFWDADLATPLQVIDDMVREADKKKAKFIIGSRIKRMGAKIERKPFRHYIGRLFATLAYFCYVENVYDTGCGAKLFRNDACLEEVFKDRFIGSWSFDVEIIARYSERSRNQGRESLDGWLVEMPLSEWRDVPGSKLHVWDFVVAGVDLLRIFFKYSPIMKRAR